CWTRGAQNPARFWIRPVLCGTGCVPQSHIVLTLYLYDCLFDFPLTGLCYAPFLFASFGSITAVRINRELEHSLRDTSPGEEGWGAAVECVVHGPHGPLGASQCVVVVTFQNIWIVPGLAGRVQR